MSNRNSTSPRSHATEWIPRTPASKAAARKRQMGISTMPRLTSRAQSPMMLPRQSSFGSGGRGITDSPSYGDRFIPNRAKMNLDLCTASMLSAEKRRMESIGKAAARQRRKLSADDVDEDNDTPLQPSHSEPDSTLQAEFNRRIKAALFDIPLERLEPILVSQRTSNDKKVNGTLESIVAPNFSSRNLPETSDLSYLAYASLPELEAEDDAVPLTRRHVSETNLMSFSNNRDNGYSNSSIPDPYEHDQLHVLQRAAAKSSYGNVLTSMSDDIVGNGLQSVVSKIGRRIPTAPTRILDAPDLVDDYYLNLISWSADNILAVALGQCVYLWNANTGDSKYLPTAFLPIYSSASQNFIFHEFITVQHLVTLEGVRDYVTSVSWSTIPGHTKYIAIGTSNSRIQLWDGEALTQVRTLNGHTARVSSLAWNSQWLSSGGRDSVIFQHDVRASRNICQRYKGHQQEVCGLKWNDDGTTLASGGNENFLCVWDAAISARNSNRAENYQPRLLLTQHKAAVKALAWCPFRRDLLASGGGTADRTIKFWNSNSGALLNSIDTGSQVCSLLWNKHQREIVSSHGFSENQLILWKYPTMTKIQEFKGHSARVLNMEMGPDGQIVSAAADETLRFWDIFGPPPNRRNSTFGIGDFQAGFSTIR